jgi:hypothetical protein
MYICTLTKITNPRLISVLPASAVEMALIDSVKGRPVLGDVGLRDYLFFPLAPLMYTSTFSTLTLNHPV